MRGLFYIFITIGMMACSHPSEKTVASCSDLSKNDCQNNESCNWIKKVTKTSNTKKTLYRCKDK